MNRVASWMTWLVLHCLASSTQPAGGKQLSLIVYNQPPSADTYLYQKDLPALSQLTMCFWFCGRRTADTDWDTLISIGLAGTDGNNMVFGFENNRDIQLHLEGGGKETFANTVDDPDVLGWWWTWHKHCFTWGKSAKIQWFLDKEVSGKLQFHREVNANSVELPAGGVLVVGQDQDGFFTGFDSHQSLAGKLAWFNIWNYTLEVDEILALNCYVKGNLVNWETLSEEGDVVWHYETFPCNANDLAPLKKVVRNRHQHMMFCKKLGMALSGHEMSTTSGVSLSRCQSLCVSDEKCLSVNYALSTSTCVLNNSTDLQYSVDLVVDTDSVHLTSRECFP